MISQKTLDALKGIGLNQYERNIFVALLARGTSTVSELSEMSGVPRSRGYDVLESLAEKGFVIIQHAKPIRFVAVNPSEALEKQKALLQDNFERGVKRIDTFKKGSAIEELKQLYSGGISLVDPSDMNGSLKGHGAAKMQIDSMIKGADAKVDIMVTAEGLSAIRKNHMGAIKKAAKRGVKVRLVAPVTDANRSDVEDLRKVIDVKEASETKVPSGKMIITDSEAIVGLTGDGTHPSQQIHFWTRSDHFTRNFAQNTFDMVWAE